MRSIHPYWRAFKHVAVEALIVTVVIAAIQFP
jgi:hypothetical protein